MAESFTLLRDEKVMLTQRATYFYSKVVAAPGVLHLTNRRLVFTPTGFLDRTLGAKGVAIPLRTIQDVAVEGGMDRRLVIKTDLSRFSFQFRTLSQDFLDRLRAWTGEQRPARPRPRWKDEEEEALNGGPEALQAPVPPAPQDGVAETTQEKKPTEKIRLDPEALARVDESKEVLILGDTDFYRVKLSHIFDRLHLRRAVFEKGMEALAAVRARPDHFALMIVNTIEPAFGGMEFLEKRMTEGLAPGVPIWVIEALFDKMTEGLLEGMDVTGFINKSVEPNEVSDALNGLFRGEPTPQARRHPRVTAYFPVEFNVGEGWEIGYVNKLGTGGIFIEADRLGPLGTEVDLRFKVLGSDEMIEVAGSVVYTVPKRDVGQLKVPGMGIKFRTIRPEHQGLIRAYIENVLQEKVNEATVIFGI